MKKLTGLLIVFGSALVVVIGLSLKSKDLQDAPPSGGRPVPVWIAQAESSAAQNSKGVFGAQAALVTPEEILLFYAIQSQQKGNIEVTAFTSQSGKEQDLKPLPVAIQSLGSMTDLEVGLIRIGWDNQPDQLITLKVTPPGVDNQNDRLPQQIWLVTPLKQLAPDPGKQSLQFLRFQNGQGAPSLLAVELGRLGGEDITAVLKMSGPKNGNPIYLRVDLQTNVTPITEAEFNALGAPVSSTPGPEDDNNITAATPAPSEDQ